MPSISNYRGIIPAIACPFTTDLRIDEPALRKLASWLAGHEGVVAVMTNGHTGEVFSLTPRERAEVTRIVADELKGRLPGDLIDRVRGPAPTPPSMRALARDAGARALDVMPPHHWLRFGFTPDHVLAVLRGDPQRRAGPRPGVPRLSGVDARVVLVATAGGAGAPALRAGLQGRPARHEQVRRATSQAIREADAIKAILTCHDEYLLASMVQGVDGALVGFATFIPQLIIDLWNAVKAGDLKQGDGGAGA